MPETQLWPARRASVNQEPEGIADTATRHRHTSCPWLRHPGVAGSNFLIVHIMQSRLPGSEWNVGTKDGFCRRNERGVSPAYLHKLPARSAPRIRQAFWGSDPAFGTQLWPMAGGAERCSGGEKDVGDTVPTGCGGDYGEVACIPDERGCGGRRGAQDSSLGLKERAPALRILLQSHEDRFRQRLER